GRPVFALPGRVDNPLSAGPHSLLRSGAHLAANLDDVIEHLGPLSIALDEPLATNEDEPAEEGQLFDRFERPARTRATVAPPPDLATLSESDRKVLAALDGSPL